MVQSFLFTEHSHSTTAQLNSSLSPGMEPLEVPISQPEPQDSAIGSKFPQSRSNAKPTTAGTFFRRVKISSTQAAVPAWNMIRHLP